MSFLIKINTGIVELVLLVKPDALLNIIPGPDFWWWSFRSFGAVIMPSLRSSCSAAADATVSTSPIHPTFLWLCQIRSRLWLSSRPFKEFSWCCNQFSIRLYKIIVITIGINFLDISRSCFYSWLKHQCLFVTFLPIFYIILIILCLIIHILQFVIL